VFDESIIASSNIQNFIDAPSPIVVYDKLSQEEAPNLFYVEYYRGGASDDTLITLDPDNPNYLDCELDGVVLNPNGAIKYYNHYHSALYEDEKFDYFIPYQVKVLDRYTGIHRGPARRFPTLALIVDKDIYTIIEERNGWGRLKEYPVGWIMLSATEPMTGPGQNPDYDVPGTEDTATLPFGSEVHITKLTIDRLWCYVPEIESWVKAEDISYNQSGKLYSALGIDVIHLDELDFSTITSLDGVGIYPQKKLLYFHDREDYVYDGEYTYDAFSALHELEFIYPETIYNYNCIYYKDNKADINELGRASFTCSIGDWNPDWDVFIDTSWKVDENGAAINPTLYRDTELTLTWGYFGFDKNLFRPEGYSDGIYLWNPRSWQPNGDIHFTFNELVRLGTQYVLYPCIQPDLYKIWVKANTTHTYKFSNYLAHYMNPGIRNVTLGVPSTNYFRDYIDDSAAEKVVDINYEGELIFDETEGRNGDMTFIETQLGSNTIQPLKHSTLGQYPSISAHLITLNRENNFYTYTLSPPGFSLDRFVINDSGYTGIYGIGEGYSVNINLSNFRESPTTIFGFAQPYEGRPYQHYIWDNDLTNKFIPLYETTNLNGYNNL
jgi:hypothetical protein